MKGKFLFAVALIVVFVTVGPASACKICTGPCTCGGLPPLAPLALGALALAHPPPPPAPLPPVYAPPPTALELSIVGPNPFAPPLYPPPAPACPGSLPPPNYLPPGYLPPAFLPAYAPNYLPEYALGLYPNPLALPPPPPPPCKYCGKKLANGLKCKCFAKNYLYPDYC